MLKSGKPLPSWDTHDTQCDTQYGTVSCDAHAWMHCEGPDVGTDGQPQAYCKTQGIGTWATAAVDGW
jgi:hypothetical protein